MKKIFAIALVAAAACSTASAEGLYLGGRLGFEHDSAMIDGDKVTTNSFSILPEIGYSFNDKWGIGTTIGYEYAHYCGWKYDIHMYEFNPYARFTYFRTSNDLVSLFIDGGVGIGAGWDDLDVDGYESHTAFIWNVGFRPGIAVNLTNKFSVVAHLGFIGYQGANNTAYNAGYDRKGGISFDTKDLTLGFYYNF